MTRAQKRNDVEMSLLSFGQRPDQKGMALLITLSLLSILIVLVFSLSHQGTLEAQQAMRLEQQLQRKELWNGATHAISSFLSPMDPQKQAPPNSADFILSEMAFNASFYTLSNQFNLNDLRENLEPAQEKLFAEAIKKAKLQPYRQNIHDLVASSPLPWVELEKNVGSLCSEAELEHPDISPWATKHLSVLPVHSVIVTVNAPDDPLLGRETLIYSQQPLTLVARYHAQ